MSCQECKIHNTDGFPHTSAHFKWMWGTQVKGRLLLNAHEKPMLHEGDVNISEASQAKPPETQEGAYFSVLVPDEI